jgi:hypothetical protein
VKWFGRGQQEREEQQQLREQEAQRWLDQHNAEKLERAAARAAQASQPQAGGGISHSGSEDLTISGQAFGQGAEVRNVPQGEVGGEGGDRGGGHRQASRGGAERGGHEGPYIVNTGGGQVNVQRSAVGHDIHMTNYGDRESVITEGPQAGQELEAGQ